MSRNETRKMLMSIVGNNNDNIEFGFPMKEWYHADNKDEVDGRLVHQWLMHILNSGECFNSHDGSMILKRDGEDIIGHYDTKLGVWVFSYGRIQYFRKPRTFSKVTWKDLTKTNIDGELVISGLPQHEGEDYLAVFPSVYTAAVEWVKVQGLIDTNNMLPTHLPMAVRFLHTQITKWIKTYDSSVLKRIVESNDIHYGQTLGDINWLSSIFEQPFWTYNCNVLQASILKDYRESTRNVKAVREIWRYYLTLTKRTSPEETLSVADYYRPFFDTILSASRFT
jgi:hypothetical protein